MSEPYSAPRSQAAPPPPPTLFDYEAADDSIFDLPVDETGHSETEAETPTPAEAAPTGAVEYRKYQERAIKSAITQFKRHKLRSTLGVLATGTGKSVIIAGMNQRFYSDWGHGVLNLCHRDELIDQMIKACGRVGIMALKEMGKDSALEGFGFLSNVVAGSVQSLTGNRLKKWPRDAFKLIIVDEAHHAVAPGYKRIFDHFSGAKIFGLTATADRFDGKSLGSIFESLAIEYNLDEAVEDGWLVRPKAFLCETHPKIDLTSLRVTGSNDFNQADLDAKITENVSTLVNAVADTKDQALQNRRTIAFAPDIASSKAMACAFSDIGISAEAVWGLDKQRSAKLKAHQNGEFQILVNAMLLTEGYDDPEVSCIIIARPTQSRGLYSQMVGRGTRLHPASGKTDCMIIDFDFITGKLELVSPVDLLDTADESEEVLQIAKEILKSGRESDLKLALEEAREDFESQRRIRIQRREVQVKAGMFDLLLTSELFDIPIQKEAYAWGDYEPATDRQVEGLKKFGVKVDETVGKATASKMLDKLMGRVQHGWTTPVQIRDLVTAGFDVDTARKMRSNEAEAFFADNPVMATAGQRRYLRSFGVSDAEIDTMTKKDAIARLNKFTGKSEGR